MKLLSFVVAVAIISAILPAQAQDRAGRAQSAGAPLAITDPLKLIYRVSGVADNGGGANAGVATAFHCTNFSQVTETISFVVRNFDGTKKADQSFALASLATGTASTHITALFVDGPLATGLINQGSAQIQSTSLQVHCSAMIVDAAATVPQGIALHMVRINPASNSQE